MYLSVVIPVFNEERSIRAVLDEHIQRLGKVSQWEILCLDDASTDGSWAILEEYASSHPHLRLLRHEKNQGISLSFQRLFREAKGDHIYATAADGQWPAEDLTRLLMSYEETQADVIIGVRQRREEVYSIGRRALSFGFNRLAQWVLGDDLKDVNGIKLGRRDFFMAPVRSKSYFAEVERLFLAQSKGYRIVCAPVIFLPRRQGKAQGARLKNIILTLRDFLATIILKKDNVYDHRKNKRTPISSPA